MIGTTIGLIVTYLIGVALVHFICVTDYKSASYYGCYWQLSRRRFLWYSWGWPLAFGWAILRSVGGLFRGWGEALTYLYAGDGKPVKRGR